MHGYSSISLDTAYGNVTSMSETSDMYFVAASYAVCSVGGVHIRKEGVCAIMRKLVDALGCDGFTNSTCEGLVAGPRKHGHSIHS